jgi:hypothetical protein
LVFSVPAANGVATYNWTPPANVSITSGQGTNSVTVSVAPGFTVGNLCVTATSTCGVVSAARCKTISSTLPGTPGNISGATNGICGQTITYSVPVVAGITSYNWILPSGATLASANGNSTVDVTFSGSFTTGQLCVTANNSCGTSTARCVNVKGAPSTPGIISGPVTVCTGEQGTQYTVGSVFGATGYNWVVPAGATIIAGQNTTTILVDWGTTGGLVTVTATNGCGTSGTRTLSVIINCKESSSVLPGVLVNAYPNPVNSELTLTLETVTSGAYTAELLDVSGRVVLTEMISAVSGENTTKLNVSELAKGMYMLSIKNAEGFAKQIRIAVE